MAPYYDTPEGRAAWDKLNAAGGGLPPYDEAGAELQRLWHHMQRLTFEDIAQACDNLLQRQDSP